MEHTSKKGLITALSCYIIWGLLPLYWALLNHVSPYNILAQRIIWSGVCMAIVVFGLHFKQFKKDFQLLKEQRSQLFLLLVAAVIISVNWFTDIWAISIDDSRRFLRSLWGRKKETTHLSLYEHRL